MPQKRRLDSLAQRARRGGLPMQLAFACCHLVMHVGTAVCLMLVLELATETFIKCAFRVSGSDHACGLRSRVRPSPQQSLRGFGRMHFRTHDKRSLVGG